MFGNNECIKRAYIVKVKNDSIVVKTTIGGTRYIVDRKNINCTTWNKGWHGTLHIMSGKGKHCAFYADA